MHVNCVIIIFQSGRKTMTASSLWFVLNVRCFQHKDKGGLATVKCPLKMAIQVLFMMSLWCYNFKLY